MHIHINHNDSNQCRSQLLQLICSYSCKTADGTGVKISEYSQQSKRPKNVSWDALTGITSTLLISQTRTVIGRCSAKHSGKSTLGCPQLLQDLPLPMTPADMLPCIAVHLGTEMSSSGQTGTMVN